MIYLVLIAAIVAGVVIAYLARASGVRNMPLYLAFSGAFLFAMTVLDILPGVFVGNPERAGIFILVGVLLQIVLEFFSRGAEHGHIHIKSSRKHFPWALLISLSVHALFEGFPITDNPDILYGIIVHKIPVTVILTLFFIRSGYAPIKIGLFLTAFGLMTPLGYALSNELSELQDVRLMIDALVVGIFLHISTTILYEIGKDHKFNLAKLITIVLGFFLAYLI